VFGIDEFVKHLLGGDSQLSDTVENGGTRSGAQEMKHWHTTPDITM
jgi:hypothetical protein